MNIKTLLLLSFTLLTACGGSGSDDTNEKNTQSASQTNPVNISPFKKLQGVWKVNNSYYSFDDKGLYKVFFYDKERGCNLILDSYTVNNSGRIDFKQMNKLISDVDIKNEVITITQKLNKETTINRLYKTPKIEQELGSVCDIKKASEKYSSINDIRGTWKSIVSKDGQKIQVFMDINNNLLNIYATTDDLGCYIKTYENIRLHEIGYGFFANDKGGSFIITTKDNSLTLEVLPKGSKPVENLTKSYQNVKNFNICKE